MNHMPLFSHRTRVQLLCLLLALLLGIVANGATLQPAMASSSVQNASFTVEMTTTGFSPDHIYIQQGDTVTWRNQTANPLRLTSGLPSRIFLPMVAEQGGGIRSAEVSQVNPGPQNVASPFFETLVNPGGEFSFQFTTPGAFTFFMAEQPEFVATVNVAEGGDVRPIACAGEGAGSGAMDTEMPRLLYATDEERTLLRWYWDDCTTANFQIYRSENGGPESLIATVTPVTDPAAAEALLNNSDPRWPDLATRAADLILQADDFSQDRNRTEIADIFDFLYSNGFAALHLTNQYYPLALMLGWGYVDQDVTPGVNYTYRVVAATGGEEGTPLELDTIQVMAGQRTPLAAPTELTAGQLDEVTWDGNWGRYQRNRRYDGQIFLNWSTQYTGLESGALIIGYDVFSALATDDGGRVIDGEKVLDANAADGDAIVVPGPVAASDGVNYLFRYAPGDYDTHTLCVAPRDLLNQPIRWPQDAAQCSDPVTLAAPDYMPPAAPQNVSAVAIDDSTQVNLTWQHPQTRDVDGFIVQRSKEMHCTAGDCWTEVATLPGNQFAWSDMSAPCENDPLAPEGCWYRVVASDAAGNRSAPSQAVYAIIHDTTPPTQMDINSADCANTADPDNSYCVDIDSDAVSIRLNCRFTPNGEEIFLTDIDAADFEGLDLVATIKSVYQPPLHLQDVACRLILADEYGNLSDIDDSPVIHVDIDSDNADQLAQPMITEIESIFEAPGDWAATVRWEMAPHPMLAEFMIERQHSSGVQNFVGIDPAARNFTDVNVMQGEVYTYVVHAIALEAGINGTVSQPRSHRVLPGENRPLTELVWSETTPSWTEATATTVLQVVGGVGTTQSATQYAVFRSLHEDRDYLQITPILQTTANFIHYEDTSAQRGCYYYVVVTFRTRDGEPIGYTEPRQAQACSEPETVYTPGPAVAAPAYPLDGCRAAVQPLAPMVNFHFGGGFQIVVEGVNEDHTGPDNVSGGGWLRVQTVEEELYVPVNFSGLTVNAEGYVCSGTVAVDLSTMPGGGLWLQAPGGWPYQLIGLTLQPWFNSNNTALATLDIFTGDAFTVGENVGDAAQRLRVSSARMTNSLRFTRTILTLAQQPPCTHPSLAFRLETLPVEVIPTGAVQIDESQISLTSACLRYVDRYNGTEMLITSPYSGLNDHRFANEGFLLNDLPGGAVTINPAGVDGSFGTKAALDWYASYPFAFRVQVNGGLTLSIADSQITGGTMGGGMVSLRYHQTAGNGKQATVQGTFDALTIGAGGDLVGSVALSGIDWDAFAVPAATWQFYQGAVTTPQLPAFHDANGIAQSIMWRAHATDVTPVAIPGGILPGMLDPGFNRRQTAATLAWANCDDTAIFDNVSVDAYLRRSGMTQRHIPVYSEGSQMTVHGYQFRPERFDLHFLDNALLESDIRGFVHLPFPSNIDVHLVDIQLTGDLNHGGANEAACIAGGRIPEGEQDFNLDYWEVNTRFTNAEFRQQLAAPAILWFLGDIRNLNHLTVGNHSAILPAELAFTPDGNFHDDSRNGPKYDRPDYRFQGFPYLMERFRLSTWFDNGTGETPVWNEDATVVAMPPAATWNQNGFIGLTGVPVAPYYGPVLIDAAEGVDTIVMAAWDEMLTGFAAQPRVSKEWVKLARVNITFDYDHLVHVYDAAANAGLFAGFKEYRFVPDHYLDLPGVPDPILETDAVEERLAKLQILQLDTGTVISPTGTGVYLGLSAGVAPLRALAEAQGLGLPSADQMLSWSGKLAINGTATPVYIQQYQTIWNQVGPFAFEDTTAILDELSDLAVSHLLDVDNVGGRTQGLLADKGVNIRRLRGLVQVEGEGLEVQFKRFHLSTQIEIKGRQQDPTQVAPLPADPSGQQEPPLFYAERMTLSIERHGDFMLVGKNVQSSKFKDKLDSFDATLVINATKPQFEGGLTLYGLKTGGVTIDNGSAVLGVGKDMNYLGMSFDGRVGAGSGEVLIGGDLLAGIVNPDSVVLQNNFADAMAQIAGDLEGELVGDMAGFYLRAYAGQIPIIGNGCLLSLQADAEVAFWYWQLEGPSENFGGFLSPAVYGRVLCVVDARGDLYLRYQQADGQDSFTGEGYIAGGIGNCEPSAWGDWVDRWWGDSACMQAGAGLNVSYTEGDGWDVSYNADYERLFGD